MFRSSEEAIATRARDRRRALELETTLHEMPLAGLPPELAGTRVVQLSDLHWGCGRTQELLETAVARASALEPDYIVLTGDFVDGRKREVLPVVRLVAGLRARRGIFASLGNHDHRADPLLLESALEAAGIRVLNNAAVPLADGLWLAGVDDLYEGRPDLRAALEPLPPDAAAILLSHNPAAVDLVPPGRPLTILSGHTHGGQLVLPFPPPEMICWYHLRTRYVHGWYHRGAARLYVHRGLGVTGPGFLARRIHCPSEIAEFRLVPAAAPA